MNTYLINATGFLYIIIADNPKKAYINFLYDDTMPISYMFIDRKDLLEKGYVKIESTVIPNVWKLLKLN